MSKRKILLNVIQMMHLYILALGIIFFLIHLIRLVYLLFICLLWHYLRLYMMIVNTEFKSKLMGTILT
jgi:hypothetical protein